MWLVVFIILKFTAESIAQNEAPIFDRCCDMRNLVLHETTKINTKVYQLKAADPEGETVTYGVDGDVFYIDRRTGDVFLIQPLDYERVRQIKVTVSARDRQSTTYNSVTVQILDDNDEVPQFSKQTYEARLKENVKSGVIVIDQLSVTDKDIVNKPLTVTCSADAKHRKIYGDVCKMFVVQPISYNNLNWIGRLVLNGNLDFESHQSYQVPLVAFDGLNSLNRSVEVTVIDVQDTPPKFIKAIGATISENAPKDQLITTIIAEDGDKSLKRKVLYELINNPGDFFHIGKYNGQLKPNKNIDREDPLFYRGYIDLIVKASELISTDPEVGGNDHETTAYTTIRININDVNDNKPLFDKSVYSATIPEDIPRGSPLPNLVISVTDEDQKYAYRPNLSSRYDISLTNFNDVFEVVPKQGRATTVVGIQVKDATLIDFDNIRQNYELKLLVREATTKERFSSTALVNIKVLDVNDLIPFFSQTPYIAEVSEVAGAGHSVIRVQAVDKDTGNWGTTGIFYELLGNGAELFHINKRSGYISVHHCAHPGKGNCIDYEQTQRYTLSVSATDDLGNGQTVTTTLIINVKDINDNEPRSLQSDYYGTIRERSVDFLGDGITIQAIDADANSVLRFSILSQTGPDGTFAIDKITGKISGNPQKPVVFSNSNNGVITLTIGIFDGIHTGTTSVHVNVIDVNDYAPEFTTKLYSRSLHEETKGETFVVSVFANDKDSPQTNAGKFVYSIESGSHGKFRIESSSGRIYTTVGASFDFDRQKLFKMQVHATDYGNPRMTGSSIVNVHIVDRNNRNPIFPFVVKREEVYENAKVGSHVTDITAVDPDTNHVLEYSMTAVSAKKSNGDPVMKYDYRHLFKVHSATGNITVNQQLDRDKVASVTYIVKATDTKAATLQTGTASLVISILDINDKAPIFRPPWTVNNPNYHVVIDEEMNIGRFVGIFPADDPDGSISRYQIVEDFRKFFSINEQTGRINIAKRIDYESEVLRDIRITIRAYDSGLPELSTDATVHFNIQNINDNTPKFDKDTYNIKIFENIKSTSVIHTISATDRDVAPCNEFKFSLDGADGIFSINPGTGEMFVSSRANLDRESQANYTFEVIVKDSPCRVNGSRNENSASMNVELLDINDNIPEFTKDMYSATVLETLPAGESVMTIEATDLDSSDTNALVYSKVAQSGDSKDLFTVTRSGLVITLTSLNGHEGVYTFNVEVKDNNGIQPYHFNQAQVRVTILDVTNHSPEWVRPEVEETVDVLESQYLGMLVYDCHAIDRDGGDNGRITYGFHVGGRFTQRTPEFQINPVTGVIRAETVFDRELKDHYSLILVAHDNSRRPQEVTRIMSIKIIDVNDHLPEFSEPRTKTCIIEENLAVDSVVCSVRATDLDINDTIRYTIVARNDHAKLFKLDPVSGVIKIVQRLGEDRNDQYLLEVEATNVKKSFSLVRSRRSAAVNTMSVVIVVVDQNDHHPVFVTHSPKICVSPDIKLQSTLYTMIATDKDKSDSLTYSVDSISRLPSSNEDVSTIFSTSPHSGVLINELLLGSHEGSVFHVKVSANDSKNSNSTVSQVYVSDPHSSVALISEYPREFIVGISVSFQRFIAGLLASLQSKKASDVIVCLTSVKSHVNHAGVIIDQWSDIYINAFDISGSKPRLYDKSELSGELEKILGNLTSFGVKNLKPTASNDSWAWTRPLLVSFIIICILIILVILLVIICLCCCCTGNDEDREIIVNHAYEIKSPHDITNSDGDIDSIFLDENSVGHKDGVMVKKRDEIDVEIINSGQRY